ncbi:MAG: DNA primase [Myxococcales bacterium]|nr:DNA primase [Myxococcales bacterium]
MISNAVREQVRARVELAELVSHYLPLRRAGTSLVARCPFHDEKSPSFHVSRDKGLFYCFGCKASGDIFDFYQRIEGVSFPEAIRALAERAGIEVVEEARDPQKIAEERRVKELTERLFHACEAACEFFEQCLESAERSEIARDAIAARGVSMECAKTFRLGYAPGEWSALAEHFRTRGVSPADAELAGLLLARNTGGVYDRFRHRLMFPVFDRQGRVVAFSGRVLPVTEDMAEGIVPENAGKYINSPETPIYRKSDLLYGLQVARHTMVKSADAILVEGNFDVVAMHQHGFTNTVCPLGTAFTEQQAKLLRRFAETVTILFDADEAGRKAVRASHSACVRAGLVARVTSIPRDRAKDPDELLRTPGGPEFLTTSITSAKSLVEWLIDDAAANAGDTVPERVSALRTAAGAIGEVRDALERAAYTEHAARAFMFNDRAIVEQAVREAQTRAVVEARSSAPFGDAPKTSELATRDEPFRKAPQNQDSRDSADPTASAASRADLVSRATADAIDALLRNPTLLATEFVDELVVLVNTNFARPLIELAREQWTVQGSLDGAALLTLCPNERARAWLGERLVHTIEPDPAREASAKQAVMDCIRRLRDLVGREKARKLRMESARAEAAGDRDRAAALQREAILLVGERHPKVTPNNTTKRSVG